MKFQPDHLDGVNAIARLEPGRLWVHQTPFESHVIVPWRGPVQSWPVVNPSAPSAADFERVLALEPELVIFGSGATHRFVSPRELRALIERRIGFEAMDTAAACRTYNVLVNEGRKVVGAFVLAPSAEA